jgi:anti-sigma factor RsiW
MKLVREITCREVVELVTAYLEDALSPVERERFEQHLVSCEPCRTYLEQMRQTVAIAGRVELRLPPELEDRLLAAFRSWRTT